MAPAVSPFFNNFHSFGEQALLDSLVRESIYIHGQAMWYIPRVITNLDKIYTADDESQYNQAFEVPIYIESADRFQGDGSFMSKFGVEIRDQTIFAISTTVFSEEITSTTSQVRPNEGDLIYFPLNDKCFQIKFVQKFEMFYPLGKLYSWQMQCELFEYSNETINTGYTFIDKLQPALSINILDATYEDESGNWLADEGENWLVLEAFDLDTIYGTGTNEDFQEQANTVLNWSETDPFSDGNI
jgi:Virus neck protein